MVTSTACSPEGPPAKLAATLRAYAAAGIHRVQVALDPCIVAVVEAFAPVLDLLAEA